MEYDIEAYLEGNLTEADLAAFEAELASNPAFQEEVNLQSQIRQHLKQQLLREQVGAALNKPDATSNKPSWLPLLGLALLVLMGNYFFNSPKSSPSVSPEETIVPQELPAESNTPTAPPANQTPESLPSPPSQKTTPPPKEQPVKQPIAQNNPSQPLSAPPYPGPKVRGAQAGDDAWKALIDALWYTNFPPATLTPQPPYQAPAQLLVERNFPRAYVSLQRLERAAANNDTLRYLKGYCLLEMGEGATAIRYFEKLEEGLPQQQEQLEWYRGLAYLISGEREQAMVIFKKIITVKDHSYHLESKKAVSRLQ